jgi:hypothetical protein
LFVISVAHDYYAANCEDIGFDTPTSTAALLQNGKLLAREVDGKLHVLFETDDTGKALMPMPGRKLRFGLRLKNLFFRNFTKLDQNPTTSSLIYRNAAASTALDQPLTARLIGRTFSHSLVRNARPLTVNLKNSAGAARQTDVIVAAANRATVSYDLTTQGPGLYSIEETDAAGATTTAYYFDVELLAAGIFGVIEVKIDNGFYTAAAPPDFEIGFEARKETLKYYVVGRNYADADINQLTVVDAGFGEDKRAEIKFATVLSNVFTGAEISPVVLLSGAEGKVVLFKSQADVARAEKARKKIQLQKNGEILIEHLPQPSPEKATSDLIIPVSKP